MTVSNTVDHLAAGLAGAKAIGRIRALHFWS